MKHHHAAKKASLSILSLSLFWGGMGVGTLPPYATEVRSIDSYGVIENLQVSSSLAGITLSFTLPVDGITYTVYKGERPDLMEKIGTTQSGEYTDHAGLNQMAFYQIQAEANGTHYESAIVRNETATGMDSLQNALIFQDLSEVTFDGNTCVTFTPEEMDQIRNLTKGTILIHHTPAAGTDHTQALFMARPSSTATDADQIFASTLETTTAGNYRPALYWVKEDGAHRAWTNSGLRLEPEVENTNGIALLLTGNRMVQAINGDAGEFFYNQSGFFSNIHDLESFSVGGWMQDEEVKQGYVGTIDWIAISDEQLTQKELCALSAPEALDEVTTEYSVSLDPADGEFEEDTELVLSSTASAAAITLPESVPVKEGCRFLGWKRKGLSGRYQPGQEVLLNRDNASVSLIVEYETAENPGVVCSEAKGGYASVQLRLDNPQAETVRIFRQKKGEGEPVQIAQTSGSVFTDQDLPKNATYVYTIQSLDGSWNSPAVEASVGFDAYRESGEINEDLADVNFDGSTLVDVSDASRKTASLHEGSILYRFKTTSRENMAILFGKNAAGNPGLTNDSSKQAIYLARSGSSLQPAVDLVQGKVTGNGNSLADGNWHAVVINCNADTLGIYVDGERTGQMSGSSAEDFLSTLQGLNELTIGGYFLNGEVASGFTGNMEYLVVNREALSDEQAKDLSAKANHMSVETNTALRDALFSGQKDDDTWVFAGGTTTFGGYDQVQGTRNYVRLLEEYWRWDATYHYGDQQKNRHRFMTSTAAEGKDTADHIAGFEEQVRPLNPKAYNYMVDEEDFNKGEEGIDQFKKDLNTLITLALSLRNGTDSYMSIETPWSRVDEAEDGNAALYAQAVRDVLDALSPSMRKRIMLVDLYEQTLDSGFKEKALDENGKLTSIGHLELCRLVSKGIYGRIDGLAVSESSFNLKTAPQPDVYSDKAPSVTSHAGSLSVSVEEDLPSAWSYTLTTDSGVIEGSMEGHDLVISNLKDGDAYSLVLLAEDGSMQLNAAEGIVGEGQVSHAAPIHTENKTDLQKQVETVINAEDPQTWLFVGDSITHGALWTSGYDSISQSFEKYLKEDLGRKDDLVVNTAISGATSVDHLNDPDLLVRNYTPDVMVVMLGMNDCDLLDIDDDFEENLKTIAGWAREKNPDCVIVFRTPNTITDPDLGDYALKCLPRLCERTRKAADEIGAILVDHQQTWDDALALQPFINTAGYWNGNRSHPNGRGQNVMFKDLINGLGLKDTTSPQYNLDYPLPLREKSSKTYAGAVLNNQQISVDLADLEERSGQTIAKATVKAVHDGVTYSRSYVMGEDATVVIGNLPEAAEEEWTVSVETELHDEASIVTYKATFGDPEDPDEPTPLIDEIIHYAFTDGSLDDEKGNYAGNGVKSPTFVNGFSGSGLQMGDGLGYVTIDPSLKVGTDDFSVSFWLRLDEEKNDTVFFSNKPGDGGRERGVFLCNYNGLYANAGNGSGRYDTDLYSRNTTVLDGGWHMVTAVWDRDAAISLYVDGKLSQESTILAEIDGTSLDTSTPFTIGVGGSGGYAQRGVLDEFKLYSAALDASQIKQLYQADANALNKAKESLSNLIDEAESLKESEAWNKLDEESREQIQTAIDEAKAILDNPKSAITDYSQAFDALDEVVDPLRDSGEVTIVNKILLSAAVAYVDAVSEEDLFHLNSVVKKELNLAMDSAKSILADPSAGQSEVDAAWRRLVAVIHMLNFTSDKTALNALIVQAGEIESRLDEYTEESRQTFIETLDHAREIAASDTALDESIEAARAALEEAMNGLHTSANKTLLNAAIAYVEAIPEEELTNLNTVVRKELDSAMEEARSVSADSSDSQSEVDAAWRRLCAVIHMLDFTSDKAALNALIAQAEIIEAELDQYQEEGKQAFLDALNHAREIAASDTALDESIEAARAALEEAMNGLQKKADDLDLSMLEWLVEQAQLLNEEDYTPGGLETLHTALDQALSVLENPESQQQVDAALAELNEAILGLRLKPTEELLKTLNDFDAMVMTLDLSLFDEVHAANILNLLSRVQAAIANPETSRQDAQALVDEVNREAAAIQEVLDKVGESTDKPATTPDTKPDVKPDTKPDSDKKADKAAADKDSSIRESADTGTEKSTKNSVKTAAGTGFFFQTAAAAGAAGLLAWLKRRNRK